MAVAPLFRALLRPRLAPPARAVHSHPPESPVGPLPVAATGQRLPARGLGCCGEMTHRDAATRCSFPLSRISLPKAMAGTGSLWDDPAIPMGAGKPGDGPASPQKPLRSQAEKQSIAERLSLGFILVPRKSPLGYYMGQLVPSKTSSFRRSQPTEVHPGAAWQLATHSPSTILSHRAPLGAWLARASPNTIPRTGRATDRNQLRANKILLLPPTRPALDRWRPVSLPRVVRLFKPPSPASQEPKPTSRSKLAPKKATIDARRAQRADWQAAKGKAVKKHIFEEPPVPSETTILDEKEVPPGQWPQGTW